MSGFTYNGVHSSTYHVEYIPDPSDRWFEGPDFEVYEEDVAWHPGGYCYGTKAKIREITLKCWYNEITQKQREDIRHWLGRNTSGQLILDDMPFVYWNVRPGKIITGNLYDDSEWGTMDPVFSGTFTIPFTAHNPFGYLTRKSNDGTEDDNASDYCGLIPTSQMPAAPTTSSKTFRVYNPGTEKCGLSLVIGGPLNKTMRYFNETNGTQCVINGLPASGSVLDINGDTGLITVHVEGALPGNDYGYAYHDRGYVVLDPGQNTIKVQKKDSNGVWVTPNNSDMTFSSITVDYNPRIL